ncbi:hypothetical protein BY996DRAFT_8338118 [Phakopsora pachyrhizi]|nr:hypothetical protein BY996DRAFT_8338118 [Phakopsora pachyrhizi]
MSGFEWARSCSSERNCRKISVVTGNASEAFSQRPGRLLRLDSNSSTRSFETDSSYPAEALSSATTIFFPNNLVTFDINKPAQKFLSAERNGQEDGLFELYKPRLREETDLAAEIEQERTDSCLRQAKVTCEFSSRPLEFSKGQSPSMEHIGVITDDEDTIHKRNNRYSNSVLKSWQSTRLKTSPV